MFKVKGREVIKVDFTWSKDEMLQFMDENWNKEEYSDYNLGKPQPGSIEEYICLPATENCVIIAYPRKNKIIFTVADNSHGLVKLAASAIPTRNAIARIYQSSLSISRAKEFKGPAAEVCEIYANYMKELLEKASKLN